MPTLLLAPCSPAPCADLPAASTEALETRDEVRLQRMLLGEHL